MGVDQEKKDRLTALTKTLNEQKAKYEASLTRHKAALDRAQQELTAIGTVRGRKKDINRIDEDIRSVRALAFPGSKETKELEKLDAEIAATRANTAKAESETKSWWRSLTIEAFQIVAGVVPILTVLLALWTLYANLDTQRIQNDREQQKLLSDLAVGLGDRSATIRSARASALAPYLKDDKTVGVVATIIVAAIVQEDDDLARGTLVQTLRNAGPAGGQTAQDSLPTIRTALDKIRLDLDATRIDLSNLKADQTQRRELLSARSIEIAARRRARQHGAVTLALLARDLRAPGSCTPAACGKCRADLTDFYLDEFDFADVQIDLCGADFSKSSLINTNFSSVNAPFARFVETDLRQATFRGSTLSNADFSAANLGWQSAGEGKSFPRTDFSGADLSSAIFTRACLSWADLAALRQPLTIDQLRDAYAEGARLDPALEKQLKDAGALKGGPRCEQRP